MYKKKQWKIINREYTKIKEIDATNANGIVTLAGKYFWKDFKMKSYLSEKNSVINILINIHSMFPVYVILFHATKYNYYNSNKRKL